MLTLATMLALAAPGWSAWADPALDRARAALARAPIIDGHNDVPWALRQNRGGKIVGFDFRALTGRDREIFHTDLERLKAGGFGGVFWSVYVPGTLPRDEAVRTTFEQIDTARRLIDAYPERMAFVTTAAEAQAAMRAGKVASFLGAEGGHSIGNSLGTLRQLHAAGVRYMTLTHSQNNDWADSGTDRPRHGGLTDFGREVVREMNRLGMLVDLSHTSPATMAQALDVTAAPVIFSHSSAYAVTAHPRNVPDEILRRMPANGGVVMVTFVPSFVSENSRAWSAQRSAEEARLRALHPHAPERVAEGMKAWDAANPRVNAAARDVADHIDHVRRVAGIDHIGIGSDYDGVPFLPTDLADAGQTPALFAELVRRGYSDADLAKIAQGNILRALRQAEAVAARLQKERGPSELLFAASAPAAAAAAPAR